MATKKDEKVTKKATKESAKTVQDAQKEEALAVKAEKSVGKPAKKATETAAAKQKVKETAPASSDNLAAKRTQNAAPAKKTTAKTLQKPQAPFDNRQNDIEKDTEIVVETVSSETKKPTYKKYHISQRNDTNMWQVKAEGADKALKLFKTQQEAIEYAKKVAETQNGSIMIHKKDGSFRKINY